MKVTLTPTLPGDSDDYEMLHSAVQLLWENAVPGMTCEIGLRRGGGTKAIIDALKDFELQKLHIAIDPYGNIEYHEDNIQRIRRDYTNTMRDECLIELYLYCLQNQQAFQFFNLEDTEFFARYFDGVPVYDDVKTIENEYALVHFDGPHSAEAIRAEIDFFDARTPKNAVFVFDDVALYDHEKNVDPYLLDLGWDWFEKGERKWSYVKC